MRSTCTLLHSGYVAFLKQTAGAPEFAGLVGGARGKAVGKAFRELSSSKRKALADVGRKIRFPKRIHGHSGFQFYMKANGGIIDEQARKWVILDGADKKGYRNRGKHIPLIKRAASKPANQRRALNSWALFLRSNKQRFHGLTGRQALDLTRQLAKEFHKRK